MLAALKAAVEAAEQRMVVRFDAIEKRMRALEQHVQALDARTVPMVRRR